MKKKIIISIALVLTAVLLFTLPNIFSLLHGKGVPTSADESQDESTLDLSLYYNFQVVSPNVFVFDEKLGLLFSKGDMDGMIYPASITKLYTANVALQYLDVDEIINVGNEVSLVSKDASRAHIYKGHRLTVGMLIEGMLLPSGNDAAYVVAAAAGRKILGNDRADMNAALEAFLNKMNEQAEKDGLTGSHFTKPDGYHSEDHYTSMNDMLKISQLVLKNKTITDYTQMSKADVRYLSGQTVTWYNSNFMLHPESEYYRPGVIGLKTGHTNNAGHCIITAEKYKDHTVIIGVFGSQTSEERYDDTVALFDETNLLIDNL